MILIPLRLGLFLSFICFGLGLYFLHDVFVNSGKDVVGQIVAWLFFFFSYRDSKLDYRMILFLLQLLLEQ